MGMKQFKTHHQIAFSLRKIYKKTKFRPFLIKMEPSTLLPIDGLSEGYGLRDDALDQLLMTTGYREITLQYRSAIKRIQVILQ